VQILEHRRNCRVAVVSENVELLSDIKRMACEHGHSPYELLRNEEIDCWKAQNQNPFVARLAMGRLEAVKGFEFDTVIAADLSAERMPRPSITKDEYWRAAAAVYGAVTRARDELIITWSGNPSVFLSVIAHAGKATIGIQMPNDDKLIEYLGVRVANR
jgi:superfamily I DNA/RNA helicase